VKLINHVHLVQGLISLVVTVHPLCNTFSWSGTCTFVFVAFFFFCLLLLSFSYFHFPAISFLLYFVYF
jgi:hypothetical protein